MEQFRNIAGAQMSAGITVIDGACFNRCVLDFVRSFINSTEGILEDFLEKVTF